MRRLEICTAEELAYDSNEMVQYAEAIESQRMNATQRIIEAVQVLCWSLNETPSRVAVTQLCSASHTLREILTQAIGDHLHIRLDFVYPDDPIAKSDELFVNAFVSVAQLFMQVRESRKGDICWANAREKAKEFQIGIDGLFLFLDDCKSRETGKDTKTTKVHRLIENDRKMSSKPADTAVENDDEMTLLARESFGRGQENSWTVEAAGFVDRLRRDGLSYEKIGKAMLDLSQEERMRFWPRSFLKEPPQEPFPKGSMHRLHQLLRDRQAEKSD